jgi:hypothetical protein
MSWATLNAAATRVAFDRLGSVSVIAGAVTGQGFLIMPGQVILDGMVISTDYTLTVLTDDFGGLLYGAGITVDGINYSVREARKVDDGTFSEILLSKLAADSSAPGQNPRTFGLQDLSDVSITNPIAGDAITYNGDEWTQGRMPKSATIVSPRVGDAITLFFAEINTTLRDVQAVVQGTSPSVTFVLKKDENRSSPGTAATTPTAVTNTTTGQTVPIVNQPIFAGQYVWLEITAVTGTVSELSISIEL